MITLHPNYLARHQSEREDSAAQSLTIGCARLVHGYNGAPGINFRGTVPALAAAISDYGVTLDCVVQPAIVRKLLEREADNLRGRGVGFIFHGGDNDIEIVAVPTPDSQG